VADLKDPLTLASKPQPKSCLEYIALDGDNVIWKQTGCDADLFLERHGWIGADDRVGIEAGFDAALGDSHPVCWDGEPSLYHAQRSSPLFEAFDTCASSKRPLPPATAAFVDVMNSLVR
jgi:hypothetical protein